MTLAGEAIPAPAAQGRPALSLSLRPGPPLGAIFLGVALLGAAAVGLLHLDRLPIPLCVFKAATGLPCLTCGTTRALGLLARLQPAAALAMNPLAALGALGLVPWGAAELLLLPRGLALSFRASGRTGTVLRMGAVAAVLLNWVYLVAAGR